MATPDEQVPAPALDSSPPLSPDDALASPRSPVPAASGTAATSTVSNMTTSSQPLGNLNAARRPPNGLPASAQGGMNNPDIIARVKAFHLSRQTSPAPNRVPAALSDPSSPVPHAAPGRAAAGIPSGFNLSPQLHRPSPPNLHSSPAVPGARTAGKGPSLAEKRGMKLPGGLPGQPPLSGAARPGAPARRPPPNMRLSQMGRGPPNSGANGEPPPPKEMSEMDKYAQFIDTKNGALTFKGRATVTGDGIEFTSGKKFQISLDEVDTLDELGKGNYGTVYKVRHARPKFRRQGQGLAGNMSLRAPERAAPESDDSAASGAGAAGAAAAAGPAAPTSDKSTSGTVMAMKEMRLELDDAKFQSIIMELDILHRCISPYIVDFYGAFFQEGAVYICMEFMNGGSMDKLYGDGVPENILRKMTLATALGLKNLKEQHNIIHRDVKPTNILVNTRGQVKICDFGVSGNLVASFAKTNIGCQSYMAPERISSGAVPSAGAAASGAYSVQSDIWSLGLTIIECAMGRYPYPPETYDNIFSQLSAIVDGEPPDLPSEEFSEAARDFVAGCLNKIPNLRPTYPMLLQHAWLAPLVEQATVLEENEKRDAAAGDATTPPAPVEDEEGFVDKEIGQWVLEALDRRKKGILGTNAKPALHAAPLDAVPSPRSKRDVKPVAVDA